MKSFRVTGENTEPGMGARGPKKVLLERQDLLKELAPVGTEQASVTFSFEAKATNNLYYDTGTWDRVSYTVGAFCSVKLACAQTEESIVQARAHAQQLAWEGVNQALPWGIREQRKLIEQTWPMYKAWYDPGADQENPFFKGSQE